MGDARCHVFFLFSFSCTLCTSGPAFECGRVRSTIFDAVLLASCIGVSYLGALRTVHPRFCYAAVKESSGCGASPQRLGVRIVTFSHELQSTCSGKYCDLAIDLLCATRPNKLVQQFSRYTDARSDPDSGRELSVLDIPIEPPLAHAEVRGGCFQVRNSGSTMTGVGVRNVLFLLVVGLMNRPYQHASPHQR